MSNLVQYSRPTIAKSALNDAREVSVKPIRHVVWIHTSFRRLLTPMVFTIHPFFVFVDLYCTVVVAVAYVCDLPALNLA